MMLPPCAIDVSVGSKAFCADSIRATCALEALTAVLMATSCAGLDRLLKLPPADAIELFSDSAYTRAAGRSVSSTMTVSTSELRSRPPGRLEAGAAASSTPASVTAGLAAAAGNGRSAVPSSALLAAKATSADAKTLRVDEVAPMWR